MISSFMLSIQNETTTNQEHSSYRSHCSIVNHPQVDLKSYVQRYSKIPRIMRLKFIAQVCPKLSEEAIELAIESVKTTYNLGVYEELYQILQNGKRERRLPIKYTERNDSEGCTRRVPCDSLDKTLPPYDAAWVESTSMEMTLLFQQLDAELNYKKLNSGSPYVRTIAEELGDLYVKSGKYKMAVKMYARARPYCTRSENVVSMFFNIIRVYIYMANWWNVLSYIEEAKQYSFGYKNLAKTVPIRLSCAAGLANLGMRTYKTAAQCFLLTPFESYEYSEVVSQQDLCHYAGLCALATLEITTLETSLINSERFKPFFNLAPKMMAIVHNFYNGNIEQCLKILYDIERDMRLDIYLAPHIDFLYVKIETRVQERNAMLEAQKREKEANSEDDC